MNSVTRKEQKEILSGIMQTMIGAQAVPGYLCKNWADISEAVSLVLRSMDKEDQENAEETSGNDN